MEKSRAFSTAWKTVQIVLSSFCNTRLLNMSPKVCYNNLLTVTVLLQDKWRNQSLMMIFLLCWSGPVGRSE